VRLPDFLIVGAQKCGTSWLAHQLRGHPELFVHPRELRYFSDPRNLARGPEWYARQFASAPAGRLLGEKTPGYMCAGCASVGNPRVHESLHRLLPEARLLAILRDPVERAVSAYQHHARRLRLPRGASIDAVLSGRHPDLEARYGFFHRGLYARQLAALRSLFPPERILVLVLEEDVRAAPAAALARVCRFLGVSDAHAFPDRERNVAGSRSTLAGVAKRWLPRQSRLSGWLDRLAPPRAPQRPSGACRAELRARYAPENEALFQLLGRRIEAWQGPAPEALADPVRSTEPHGI
jgi:hypothetical protein